ncbi:MAG: hypothetical protein WC815_07845 [Vicinamibacterales bacterium]
MKVALNFKPRSGPWGGGNRFVSAVTGALRARGDVVVDSLAAPDVDVIVLLDPRWRHPDVTFTAGAVLRYLIRHPRTVVVHRINECDERKKTRHMNLLLRRANYCADHTVFVGSWLKHLPLWQGGPEARSSVITNGADSRTFHAHGWQPWTGTGPLKLVTHHWGGNWMKGFDIYQRLDEMLAEPRWQNRLAFTYVGNVPAGFTFRHARHIAALDGVELASELRSHHAYLTASINEPGGNHQNEGALCGLPLLYRRSGCLPEYCDGFGVSFDEGDFEARLDELIRRYDTLAAVIPGYPHTAERMCERYLACFDDLIRSRDQIAAARRLWRSPWLVLRNQLAL